jgi:hypothetical protein
MTSKASLSVACCLVLLASCAFGQARPAQKGGGTLKVVPDIKVRRAQFVREKLAVDTLSLTPADQKALDHLVRAAGIMNAVFLRQAWAGNPDFSTRVAALTGGDAPAAKDYYRIMAGPWDRLRDFEPFLGSVKHQPGAGYYPEDMTKEEFEKAVASGPDVRKAFSSTTTVIRREKGVLVAVPYSKEYRDLLEQAASELRAAADVTTNESLKKFLRLRAAAFLSDDYYASDLAWMDLDSPLEVVIGPYETYEDGLFGYKAAFEAFVCVEQPADSAQLAKYKKELPYLESRLPIPDQYKNTTRGTASPIRVADEVVTGGEARCAVQTLAFNLPNDERVREAKGSKKVLLKNMMRAKFFGILVPVTARALPEDELGKVEFDAYFHHILFHELSHGLGPGRIKVGGRETEVRMELKELYPAIEEAKADVLGVYTLGVLANRDIVPASVMAPLPWTYVAGLFRAARFGTTDAHGLGVVIQANYLVEKGAIVVTPDGRFKPVLERFARGLKELAGELLMIEATGSYQGAQELARRYGKVSEDMAKVLASLKDIPVDVDPVFAADAQT